VCGCVPEAIALHEMAQRIHTRLPAMMAMQ
jgi:hypothetical protein